MAIFHLSAQIIKRSEGRSVVAASAYRAADRFIDDRLGIVYDYRTKEGVAHREILAPKEVPTWAFDREILWNKVEQREKMQTAQLAREVRLALPKELSDKQQLKLVRRFIKDAFVGRGMIADLCVHRDNPDNPHAHILLTMRRVSRDGFGNKDRDWNRVEVLKHWRETWAISANRSLHKAGNRARISHLSHEVRGLLTLPSIKLGIQKLKAGVQRRGFVLDRLAHTQALHRENGERIQKDPHVAFKELLYHESTFTRGRLQEYLNSHTQDAAQAQACFDAVMAHPDLTCVGSDIKRARAEQLHGARHLGSAKIADKRQAEVFTTQQTLAEERGMLAAAGALIHAPEKAKKLGASQLHQFGARLTLSEEQTSALVHVVEESGKLAVVEGFAGTGKSRMFDAARFAWEKQGKRVLGGALAGKAAEALGHSAGLADSRSLAAWEFAWDAGRDRLGKDDVFIVDEAGMVGTRQMGRILKHAESAGAKVVLAGDTEQLQAVEAGSPFAAIGALVPEKACLVSVRRQRAPWQCAASVALGQGAGGVGVAMQAYASRGFVHANFEKEAQARSAIVAAWRSHEQTIKDASQVALSYRRRDIPLLNEAIREARLQMRAVRGNTALQTEAGKALFGRGDRLVFTKNSRTLDVRNGTLGTVERIGLLGWVTVRLDGPDKRLVTFDNRKWPHVAHGYAMSVHRSQGTTVDRTHVLISRAFDRHATYVAMTRHRDRLDMYASKEEMGRTDPVCMLSRERKKSMALDYLAASQVTERTRHDRAAFVRPAAPPVLGQQEAPLPSRPRAAPAPGAPTLQELVSADMRASQALGTAERVAARPLMSAQSAFNSLSGTAQARRALQDATALRSFWREAAAKQTQDTSWAKRLGLKREAQIADPRTGVTMPVTRGLELAERQVVQAATALEKLGQTPEVQRQAKDLAREHNAPILQARGQLPALQRACHAARQARDNHKGAALEVTHSKGREIDRGGMER